MSSRGAVGEGYDYALAEMIYNSSKGELVRKPAGTGPCKKIEVLELATLGRVPWHATERLHGDLGGIPPAKYGNTLTPPPAHSKRWFKSIKNSLYQNQGGSV